LRFGLVSIGALVLAASPLAAQERLTPVAEQVNRKLVKLYGIGGFKGLPAYGTGVLVSATGHVLTVNNHILNTPDVIVHLYDGRSYRAQVISKEPALDAALLKIDDKVDGLPHYSIEQAAARPLATAGDWVLTFSNQFNIATRDEPMSVQRGVVAAYTELRGRRGIFEAPFSGHVYFIDTIACNPGAAGGVLTTRKGELLGLLGRELKNALSDSWINYAVPVQAKADILRDDKTVSVTMTTFVRESILGKYKTGTLKEKGGTGGYHGAILVPNVVTVTPPYVEDVVPGSPAAKGGLRPDDLIVYIEGDLVPSIKTFRDILKAYPPNTVLRFEVQRGNQLVSLAITLAEQPKK
jgi:serine protease Do